MRQRLFAVIAVPALAVMAGCLSSSIVDDGGSSSTNILPALENTPYDSLGGAKLSWQRFATTAGSFRGVYLMDGTARKVTTYLGGRAMDRAMQHPTSGMFVYGGQSLSGASIFDTYTMRLSDSLETRITSGNEVEQYPNWSADGSLLVLNYRGNGRVTIARQLPTAGATRDTMVLLDSQTVQWIIDSPVQINAANRVAVVTHSAGWRITTFDWGGANRVKLREDVRNDIGPIFQGASWSPDGTKLAFLQLNYDGADQLNSTTLKTMLADGSGEVSLATVITLPFTWNASSLNDFSVCWLSPTRIAFTAVGNDRASHVYIAHLGASTTLTQVTTNSGVFDRGVSCRQ
ncbi:MAG: PD40 domain-containing protein [Gemmatimonadetes bacterium]|nr:PD40 domain-containing protein [Gemmatimonadota bacterium]